MRKMYVCLATFIVTLGVSGQNFTEVIPSPFEDIINSSSTFADVDGDGDLDLFIAGFSSNGEVVKCYENDGSGNFTEVSGNSFVGVNLTSLDVADVNGDGAIDILISGRDASNTASTKLYFNDGTGQFTMASSSTFDNSENGSVNFADFDEDGDQDVLITGKNDNNEVIAKLYINDGSGNFTEQIGTPFTGVDYSSVIVFDANGDNHLDILISGDTGNPDYSSKLYFNDGTGHFTLQTGTSLIGVNRGALAYADVDNDGDYDIIIAGRISPSSSGAKLYINDGAGNFTEDPNLIVTGGENAVAGFSDMNGDSYPDLLVSGRVSNYNRVSEIFINDGNGGFTLYSPNPIEAISKGDISFADVDGDMDNDLLITGVFTDSGVMGPFDNKITRLYNLCTLVLNQPHLTPLSAICSLEAPQPPEAIDYCSGGATTVTATTSAVFPITDTSITEITWTYDNGNGLMQSQTQAINWQVIETSITVNGGTITANNTDAGVTYQWINCATNGDVLGATDAIFTPTESGSYAVVIHQNGCVDTSSCKTIDLVSLDNQLKETISIYPNPSKGDFYLDLGSLQGMVEVTVYSSIGQKVYAQKVHPNSKHVKLACSHLEEGAYIIDIKNRNQQFKTSLLIVR